jgi:hypothetical protein
MALFETPADTTVSKSRAYGGARQDLLELLPMNCINVLDLGCYEGALGRAIRTRQAARVTGVEYDAAAAQKAGECLDEVIHGNIESAEVASRLRGAAFDAVICGDVLEHLRDPWGVLRFLVDEAATGGAAFVISLPNVAHWTTLRHVWLRKSWPRLPSGIHDSTHLRWFTSLDAEALISGSGLKIERRNHKLAPPRLPFRQDGFAGRWLIRRCGQLFVFQMRYRAIKPFGSSGNRTNRP